MQHVPRTVGRLATIGSLVPEGARVAEIGADRALLSRTLLARGRASFCLAIDSSPRAIRAARAATGSGVPRLEVRLGDGLDAIEARDRIDWIVLAGIGARTILRILTHPRRLELGPLSFVLQPQTEPDLLRMRLVDHGLAIVAEHRAEERGRAYVVIAAR